MSADLEAKVDELLHYVKALSSVLVGHRIEVRARDIVPGDKIITAAPCRRGSLGTEAPR